MEPQAVKQRDVIAETVTLLDDERDELGAELSPEELALAEALARGMSNRKQATK